MSDLLSSLDVVNKAFKKTMRGYDCGEVDEFLDRVAESIQAYVQKNKEYERTIEEQAEKIADFDTMKNSLHEALLMAQRTAEEKLANATRIADERLKDAEAKSADVMAETKLKAGRLIKEAEDRADAIIKEASSHSDRITRDSEEQLITLSAEIKRLQKLREDSISQFRSFVAEVDRTVANAEGGSADPLPDLTQSILRKRSAEPRHGERRYDAPPSFTVSDPDPLPPLSAPEPEPAPTEAKKLDISETLTALGIDPSLMSAEI